VTRASSRYIVHLAPLVPGKSTSEILKKARRDPSTSC